MATLVAVQSPVYVLSYCLNSICEIAIRSGFSSLELRGKINCPSVSQRHAADHLPISGNTAHTVGVPGLPVHGHNTPLMAPLVFIHMLPAVSHIIQHTPQRSGRACTGIHARHKYPVRGEVMFIGIRCRCLLFGDPLIIIVGRKNYGVKLSSCCLSAYSTADLIA